jgi:cyclic lactone autoinducer peptide
MERKGKESIVSGAVRAIAVAAAKSSAKSASWVFMCQPKEPKALAERLDALQERE